MTLDPVPLGPARLGKSLRRVDPRHLSKNRFGTERVWFVGDEPYLEVTIDVDAAREIAWLQVSLRGWVVTWDAEVVGPRVARTNELEVEAQGTPSSKLLVEDFGRDEELIAFARCLLESRPDDEWLTKAAALLAE